MIIQILLISVLLSLGFVGYIQPQIHMFQLESYKAPQLLRHIRQHKTRANKTFTIYISVMVLGAIYALIDGAISIGLLGVSVFSSYSQIFIKSLFATGLVLFVLGIVMFILYKKKPQKKKLVYTSRVIRLIVVLAVTMTVIFTIGGYLGYVVCSSLDSLRFIWCVLAVGIFYIACLYFADLFLVLASIIVSPIEKAVKRWYYNDGKKQLASYKDMTKIGITGSYGKTSCKVILGSILAESFNVFITPHSYNTPMGVTRAIREQLAGSEDVFVAEMGARHVGDIKEMCDLVNPTIGLLTSIGPQHLETFGTIEHIKSTKYELMEHVADNGVAFFPDDNSMCKELYKTHKGEKKLFAIDGDNLYVSAKNIEISEKGATFLLSFDDGQSAICTTKLLGMHNIENILGCAAVAHHLGMDAKSIAKGIEKVEAVEHRLQLIPTGNGVVVIDDAFNSNPQGTQAAMDVLGAFDGRKIVITPGLVELGDSEEIENINFGKRMVGVVDIAILVAINGEYIEKGLKENNYSGKIIRVKSLDEATKELAKITKIGDVVLFENDLPDHYEQ